MFVLIKREIHFILKNRYLLIMTVLLALMGFVLTYVGHLSALVKADALALQISNLSSLSIFIIPLMALFISYDTINGEIESQRLMLELSYPISRSAWLCAKYLAHVLMMFLVIALGFLIAIMPALIDSANKMDSLIAFMRLIMSSTLLSAVFVGLGSILSNLLPSRSSSAGGAIGLWLFFVVIFDLALLGLLVSDTGKQLSTKTVNTLLVLNPIDLFRLLSFSHEQTEQLAMIQSLDKVNTLPTLFLLGFILLWIALPLLLNIYLFKKKSI